MPLCNVATFADRIERVLIHTCTVIEVVEGTVASSCHTYSCSLLTASYHHMKRPD